MIRKLTIISKFVTSQIGKQIITIHILPNISRTKDIGIKIGSLTEYIVRNIFPQKSCKKWAKKTSSRPFFVKYFVRPPLGHTIKTNCIRFQTVKSRIYFFWMIFKKNISHVVFYWVTKCHYAHVNTAYATIVTKWCNV